MAKYFYVYSKQGTADSIVKMFNGETGASGEKYIAQNNIAGFVDGLKTSGFVLNQELAKADVGEAEAKRVLAEKMADYHAARDTYAKAAERLKKIKTELGIR